MQLHSLLTLGLDVSGQPQALATLPPWEEPMAPIQ